MQEEIDAIEWNGTWKLADVPKGKKAISLKWIFTIEFNFDGTIQKPFFRLVARGYIQEHQIDFKETFSPSAFLNGELKEDVYVQQPEYFEVVGEEHKVYKLEKALYGLKQAPRAWYSKIDEFFHENGFERSPNEPTLYVKKQGTEGIMLVSSYVDDMIYTGLSLQLISEFKEAMMKKFEMSDLGKLSYFLGLEVQQGTDGIFLSQ
ncbi:retrovirus-related pol polyprotein from transposon TNT 1-94, partial [Tanacetum coccineum]